MSTRPVRKLIGWKPQPYDQQIGGDDINHLVEHGTGWVNVFEVVPPTLHAAIQAGTSTTDVRAYIQAAIDAVETEGGGTVLLPPGIFCVGAMVQLKSYVTLRGSGRNCTTIRQIGTNTEWHSHPAGEWGIVGTVSTGGPYTNIRVEDMAIQGINAYPIADGGTGGDGRGAGYWLAWDPGIVIALHERRQHGGRAYYAASAGTTGATGPTHEGDAPVSDGGVSWIYYGPVGSDDPWTYAKDGLTLVKCQKSAVERVLVFDVASGINVSGLIPGIEDHKITVTDCEVRNARSWSQPDNSGVPRAFAVATIGALVDRCKALNSGTGYYISGFRLDVVNSTAERWTFDDGFYYQSDHGLLQGCTAIGGTTRADGYGNGFAVAYQQYTRVIGNRARYCGNMGFRIHAPQSFTTFVGNEARECGYGYRVDTSNYLGPSEYVAWAQGQTITYAGQPRKNAGNVYTSTGTGTTGATAPTHTEGTVSDGAVSWKYEGPDTLPHAWLTGLSFVGNIAEGNSDAGFALLWTRSSTVVGNISINNNRNGQGASNAGSIQLGQYVIGNEFSRNIVNWTENVHPAQIVFGFYNYPASGTGANVENDNRINHQSLAGIDSFPGILTMQRGTESATIPLDPPSATVSGSVTFAEEFPSVPAVFVTIQNGNIVNQIEQPVAMSAFNVSTLGFDFVIATKQNVIGWVDANEVRHAPTITFAWKAEIA